MNVREKDFVRLQRRWLRFARATFTFHKERRLNEYFWELERARIKYEPYLGTWTPTQDPRKN